MCDFPTNVQDDPNALYNKDEQLTEALISITLSRVFKVTYDEGFESLTDAVMSDSNIYTIPDLLKILYDLVDDRIEQLKDKLALIRASLGILHGNDVQQEIARYERIKECCSWSVDDCEVIENF